MSTFHRSTNLGLFKFSSRKPFQSVSSIDPKTLFSW